MSLRANGSYIGDRPAGPTLSTASGVWDLRAAERQRRKNEWPAPSSDPYFPYVTLLLNMEGVNGSTTFVDSSLYGRSGITTSGASISTAQTRFGGSSLAWSNNYISIPYASSLYDFGSSPFVMEFWLYPTAKSDNAIIGATGWPMFGQTQSAYAWLLYTQVNPSDNRLIFFGDGGNAMVPLLGSGSAWNAPSFVAESGLVAYDMNQWYYVAIVRSGNTLRSYVNGVLAATRAYSGTFPVTGANLTIGGNGSGYFDSLRITAGTDRGYTGSTIAVPAGPFPAAG